MDGSVFPFPPQYSGLWTGSTASTSLLLIILDVLLRGLRLTPSFNYDDPNTGDLAAFADDFAVIGTQTFSNGCL